MTDSIALSTLMVLAGIAALNADSYAAENGLLLSADQEVPAVASSATGTSSITVLPDRSVSGVITTKGIIGVAAHVHLAPAGKNGPPIITLTKVSDNEWAIPSGAKLTDEQYASYKAGELYVNVHSATNKAGEIRGQLKP